MNQSFLILLFDIDMSDRGGVFEGDLVALVLVVILWLSDDFREDIKTGGFVL